LSYEVTLSNRFLYVLGQVWQDAPMTTGAKIIDFISCGPIHGSRFIADI
jgi:hypothetical protein